MATAAGGKMEFTPKVLALDIPDAVPEETVNPVPAPPTTGGAKVARSNIEKAGFKFPDSGGKLGAGMLNGGRGDCPSQFRNQLIELPKTGVMTASKCPSPFRSPRLTVPGPVGKDKVWGMNVGLAVPSFSYHVTVEDMGEKEKMSGWPSPLISPTVIDWAFQSLVVMLWRVQVLPSPLTFSHQLTLPKPEEMMSSLPSLLMSSANAMRTSP